MKKFPSIFFFLLLIFPIFAASPVRAATLNVPQNYSTVMAAYDAAADGDEIIVAPGSYDVCLSGNRTKRIALKAQNPATSSPASQQTILNSTCSHVIQFKTPLDTDGVFQSGDHVEFIGFVLKGSDDGFSYEAASGIVKNNIITGQSDDPIDIDGASEAHIFGNILKDGVGGGDGIENRLYTVPGSRVIQIIIKNNIIYNSRNDGIQLIDQTGTLTKRKYLIANNLIIGSGQAGLGTTQGGNSSQTDVGYALPEPAFILHNTFVNNSWGGIIGGANMKVHNNIFYNNGKVALKNVSGSSLASHNLFFGNAQDSQGSNMQNPNLFADPKFANAASPPDFSSYQLTNGSPAVNSGLNVDSYYREFGLAPPGFSGTAPDLGWLELSTGNGPTNTPPPQITNTPPPITNTPPVGGKPGDANSDNIVDGQDYMVWRANYNSQASGGASIGDFDSNARVDGQDYMIWRGNYLK